MGPVEGPASLLGAPAGQQEVQSASAELGALLVPGGPPELVGLPSTAG